MGLWEEGWETDLGKKEEKDEVLGVDYGSHRHFPREKTYSVCVVGAGILTFGVGWGS